MDPSPTVRPRGTKGAGGRAGTAAISRSMVPRPHTPAPGPLGPAQPVWGPAAGGRPAWSPSARQELRFRGNKRDGITRQQPVPSTDSHAPSCPGWAPWVSWASSARPSWHSGPLSRSIQDAVRPQQTGRAEVFMLLQAAGLSAGARVLTSPGTPSVSVEAQGSCRCTCACSQGLSERG